MGKHLLVNEQIKRAADATPSFAKPAYNTRSTHVGR
jgi:hypothetical protein